MIESLGHTIEEIKIYREWANNYLTIRSNVTYLNIVAAGLITWNLINKFMPEKNVGLKTAVRDNFGILFGAYIVYYGFSLWATSMSNIYSNSFWKYMEMAQNLEINVLKIHYDLGTGPLTYEFLQPEDRDGPIAFGFTGNAWNLLNLTLWWYSSFMLVTLSRIAKIGLRHSGYVIWLLCTLAYAYASLCMIVLALHGTPWWFQWVLAPMFFLATPYLVATALGELPKQTP